MGTKVVVAWSGGKDSALALHRLQQSSDWKVEALLTTVTEDYDRVSMHGVPRALLEAQAESLGLALIQVNIPADCSNQVYDERMRLAMAECRAQGIDHIGFGDIFLQDVRKYREQRLAQVAMQGVFPLWGLDSGHLARDFVRLGFRAVVACVDLRVLDSSFAGRELDERFLADLPSGVDPCGENGEFHSFVHDGPNLRSPLTVEIGERVERRGFVFADLRLRDGAQPRGRRTTTEGQAQGCPGL